MSGVLANSCKQEISLIIRPNKLKITICTKPSRQKNIAMCKLAMKTQKKRILGNLYIK